MDELALYDDLDAFHEEEAKKSNELQEAEEKYQQSLKTIEELQGEIKKLNKNIKCMELGFQSLLDTARAEIKRKDKEIERLRKENDDICFRRKIYKPPANTNGNLCLTQNPTINPFKQNNVRDEEVHPKNIAAATTTSTISYTKNEKSESESDKRKRIHDYQDESFHLTSVSTFNVKDDVVLPKNIATTSTGAISCVKGEKPESDKRKRGHDYHDDRDPEYKRQYKKTHSDDDKYHHTSQYYRGYKTVDEYPEARRTHSREKEKERPSKKDYERHYSRHCKPNEKSISKNSREKSSESIEFYNKVSERSRSRKREQEVIHHKNIAKKNTHTNESSPAVSKSSKSTSCNDHKRDKCERETKNKNSKEIFNKDLGEEKHKNITTENSEKEMINSDANEKKKSKIDDSNLTLKEELKAQHITVKNNQVNKCDSVGVQGNDSNAQLEATESSTTDTGELSTHRKVAVFNEIFGKSSSECSSTSEVKPNLNLNSIKYILAKVSQTEINSLKTTSTRDYVDICSRMSMPFNKNIESIYTSPTNSSNEIVDMHKPQTTDQYPVDNDIIPNNKSEPNFSNLVKDPAIIKPIKYVGVVGSLKNPCKTDDDECQIKSKTIQKSNKESELKTTLFGESNSNTDDCIVKTVKEKAAQLVVANVSDTETIQNKIFEDVKIDGAPIVAKQQSEQTSEIKSHIDAKSSVVKELIKISETREKEESLRAEKLAKTVEIVESQKSHNELRCVQIDNQNFCSIIEQHDTTEIKIYETAETNEKCTDTNVLQLQYEQCNSITWNSFEEEELGNNEKLNRSVEIDNKNKGLYSIKEKTNSSSGNDVIKVISSAERTHTTNKESLNVLEEPVQTISRMPALQLQDENLCCITERPSHKEKSIEIVECSTETKNKEIKHTSVIHSGNPSSITEAERVSNLSENIFEEAAFLNDDKFGKTSQTVKLLDLGKEAAITVQEISCMSAEKDDYDHLQRNAEEEIRCSATDQAISSSILCENPSKKETLFVNSIRKQRNDSSSPSMQSNHDNNATCADKGTSVNKENLNDDENLSLINEEENVCKLSESTSHEEDSRKFIQEENLSKIINSNSPEKDSLNKEKSDGQTIIFSNKTEDGRTANSCCISITNKETVCNASDKGSKNVDTSEASPSQEEDLFDKEKCSKGVETVGTFQAKCKLMEEKSLRETNLNEIVPKVELPVIQLMELQPNQIDSGFSTDEPTEHSHKIVRLVEKISEEELVQVEGSVSFIADQQTLSKLQSACDFQNERPVCKKNVDNTKGIAQITKETNDIKIGTEDLCASVEDVSLIQVISLDDSIPTNKDELGQIIIKDLNLPTENNLPEEDTETTYNLKSLVTDKNHVENNNEVLSHQKTELEVTKQLLTENTREIIPIKPENRYSLLEGNDIILLSKNEHHAPIDVEISDTSFELLRKSSGYLTVQTNEDGSEVTVQDDNFREEINDDLSKTKNVLSEVVEKHKSLIIYKTNESDGGINEKISNKMESKKELPLEGNSPTCTTNLKQEKTSHDQHEKNKVIILKQVITKEINMEGEIVEIVKNVIDFHEPQTIAENIRLASQNTEIADKIENPLAKVQQPDVVLEIANAELRDHSIDQMSDKQIPSAEVVLQKGDFPTSCTILPESYNNILILPSISTDFPTPPDFSGIFSKKTSSEVANAEEPNKVKKKCTLFNAKRKEYILPAASVLCNVDNLKNATKTKKKLHWELLDNKNEVTEIEDDADIDATEDELIEIKKETLAKLQKCSTTESDIQAEDDSILNVLTRKRRINKTLKMKLKTSKNLEAKEISLKTSKAKLNAIGKINVDTGIRGKSLLEKPTNAPPLVKKPVGRPKKQKKNMTANDKEITAQHKRKLCISNEVSLSDCAKSEMQFKRGNITTDSLKSLMDNSMKALSSSVEKLEICDEPCSSKDSVKERKTMENQTVDVANENARNALSHYHKNVHSLTNAYNTSIEATHSGGIHKPASENSELLNTLKEKCTEMKNEVNNFISLQETDIELQPSKMNLSPFRIPRIVQHPKNIMGNSRKLEEFVELENEKKENRDEKVYTLQGGKVLKSRSYEDVAHQINNSCKGLPENSDINSNEMLNTLNKADSHESKKRTKNYTPNTKIGQKNLIYAQLNNKCDTQRDPEITREKQHSDESSTFARQRKFDRVIHNHLQTCPESKTTKKTFKKSINIHRRILDFSDDEVNEQEQKINEDHLSAKEQRQCSSPITSVYTVPLKFTMEQLELATTNETEKTIAESAIEAIETTDKKGEKQQLPKEIKSFEMRKNSVDVDATSLKNTSEKLGEESSAPGTELHYQVGKISNKKCDDARQSLAEIDVRKPITSLKMRKNSVHVESNSPNTNGSNKLKKSLGNIIEDNNKKIKLLATCNAAAKEQNLIKTRRKSSNTEEKLLNIKESKEQDLQVQRKCKDDEVICIERGRETCVANTDSSNKLEQQTSTSKRRKSTNEKQNKDDPRKSTPQNNQNCKELKEYVQKAGNRTNAIKYDKDNNQATSEIVDPSTIRTHCKSLERTKLIKINSPSNENPELDTAQLDVFKKEIKNLDSHLVGASERKLFKMCPKLNNKIDTLVPKAKINSPEAKEFGQELLNTFKESENPPLYEPYSEETQNSVRKYIESFPNITDSCTTKSSELPQHKVTKVRRKSTNQSQDQSHLSELEKSQQDILIPKEVSKLKRARSPLLGADSNAASPIFSQQNHIQLRRMSTNKRIILDSNSDDNEMLIKKTTVIPSKMKAPLPAVKTQKQRKRRVVKVLSTSFDSPTREAKNLPQSCIPLTPSSHQIFNREVSIQSSEFAASLPTTVSQQPDNTLIEIESKLREIFESPTHDPDYKPVLNATILPPPSNEFLVDGTANLDSDHDQSSLNELLAQESSPFLSETSVPNRERDQSSSNALHAQESIVSLSETSVPNRERDQSSSSVLHAHESMVSLSETSIPNREQDQSSSNVLHVQESMVSLSETSIPNREQDQSSSNVLHAHESMVSLSETSIPNREQDQSSSRVLHAQELTVSLSETSIPNREQDQSSSNILHAHELMVSLSETSIPNREQDQSSSTVLHAHELMVSLSETSIPNREQDQSSSNVLHAHESMVSLSVTSIPNREQDQSSSNVLHAHESMVSLSEISIPNREQDQSSSNVLHAHESMVSLSETSIPNREQDQSSSNALHAQESIVSLSETSISNREQDQSSSNVHHAHESMVSLSETSIPNREQDQSSSNVLHAHESMVSLNETAPMQNRSEIKHLSLGSANYRFEKVSENVINLFISRKRKRKRAN